MRPVPDIMPISGGPFIVGARLCNFATSKSTLRSSHRLWIERDLRDAIGRAGAPWVDVIGYASKLGDESFNMNLSGFRCDAVKAQVRAHNHACSFNVTLQKGESESLGADNNDDGYWRAVEVYAYGQRPPTPVRPHPKPAPDIGSTDFEIRVVGGGSAAVIGQADDYFFQIVDRQRKLTAFFYYTGLGVGVGIPKIPGAGSAMKAGKPKPFHTTRPIQLHVFNSQASLYQDPGVTIGDWSKGGTMRLHLKSMSDYRGYVSTRPGTIAIEGGAGLQMPGLGSATEGVFALASEIFPFTGY